MPEPASVPALTILVADDDADMRLYLRTCLRGQVAARVVGAGDGVEALHLARALRPDLIVCDVVMPRLDGHGLCRALKADPALAAIPVLLISGEGFDQGQADGEADGEADGFLEKPFDAARLWASVAALLTRPP